MAYTMTGSMPVNETIIRLIEESIAGERSDELFYDRLIAMAPNAQQKQIIEGIRNDERNHNRWFRYMYTVLTGRPPQPSTAETEPPFTGTYLQGLEKALFGELRAFEKYRYIYLNIPQPELKSIMFQIMTDELKHAQYYNWLYTVNK